MYNKFSSQPHQPFFSFGILFFITFLLILGFNYSGIVSLKSSISGFHSYPLIHIVFIQFFLGFLFVVFPRFLTQAEIPLKVYMNRFFLFTLGGLTYLVSLFIGHELNKIAMIILIVASFMSFKTLCKIYQKSIVTNKHDVTWILTAFGFGLLSNILFFISSFGFPALEAFSIHMGFYLFLFALIFTISQRMIPFFSSIKVQGYQINKSKYVLEIAFGLLGLKVIALSLQIDLFSFVVDLSLFAFFTYELLKWKLPVFKVTAIMWVLYLSLFWLPVGFFISLLESTSSLFDMGIVFEKSALHTLAIGYFSTVLIGFGTRVVLGHSGRTPTADKLTVVMFWIIQAIVVIRIFAGLSLNGNFDYIFWIIMSAKLLALGLIVWSLKYLGILIKGA
ncbi:MAG TPA: NnrS family protein [Sulfurospirillum arcachonense]|nr:NnrS family protein [Sulfurospirillum arcachonense]